MTTGTQSASLDYGEITAQTTWLLQQVHCRESKPEQREKTRANQKERNLPTPPSCGLAMDLDSNNWLKRGGMGLLGKLEYCLDTIDC